MEAWITEAFERIKEKLSAECGRWGSRIPYQTENGRYVTDYAEKDIYWWTNGFWPGILWQMYYATGEEKYRMAAAETEEKLDQALYGFTGLHHDVGFMWLHSAVADWRLTGSAKSRDRGLMAASVLAGRFNPGGGFIRAWNPECVEPGEDCTGWIIVDSMMNLPLLYWASEQWKDPRFYNAAVRHADTVRRTLVRRDGSCGHIAALDPCTGELERLLPGQGYSADSAWSRGQSWIIYGFVLSYRYTKDERYLETAKQAAHYFIANVALNGNIPLCDFRQPERPALIDTSAGLCAACGLMELADWLPEGEQGLYRRHGEAMVRAVFESHCDWDIGRDSIVRDGKVEYHGDKNSTDLIYADYFFVEAVFRLMGKAFFIW